MLSLRLDRHASFSLRGGWRPALPMPPSERDRKKPMTVCILLKCTIQVLGLINILRRYRLYTRSCQVEYVFVSSAILAVEVFCITRPYPESPKCRRVLYRMVIFGEVESVWLLSFRRGGADHFAPNQGSLDQRSLPSSSSRKPPDHLRSDSLDSLFPTSTSTPLHLPSSIPTTVVFSRFQIFTPPVSIFASSLSSSRSNTS